MFALRGFAVFLSIFFVLYAALSLAVVVLWRWVWLSARPYSARFCADLLFLLRVTPFLVSTAFTLALAVPSFLLLEPRAVDEGMGTAPVLLGLCGIAVMLAGTWQATTALMQAAKLRARWLRRDSSVGLASGMVYGGGSIPVYRILEAAPPLTTTGILRPGVWLSQAAESLLTRSELETALRHELAHVHRRDNLRKLILRFAAFPGLAELDRVWAMCAETAADDAAVTNACQALDLAAAVIKLSRLAPAELPAQLTTALVHGPAKALHERVTRLLEWAERPQQPKHLCWPYVLCSVAALAATLILPYNQLLVRIHILTEWLVR